MKQVLDIGCGNFKDPRATIGIDTDPTTKADIIMDAQKLDFPKDHFDMVIMHQCLEHVEQPVTALREIHRVLKPGGTFELDIPNRYHFNSWLRWWQRGRIWVDPGHVEKPNRRHTCWKCPKIKKGEICECSELGFLMTAEVAKRERLCKE